MIPAAAPAHPSTPSLHIHPTPVRPRQSHGWSRYQCRWPLQRRCQQPAESAASKHSPGLCLAMAVFSYGCDPPKKNMDVENWASGIVLRRYLKISTWISQDLPGTHSIVPAWRPSWRYTWKTGASAPHLAVPYGALVPGDGLKKFLAMKSKAISRPSAHRVSSSLTFVIVTVHIVHGMEEGSPVLNLVTDEVTIEVDSVDKM